MASNEGAHLPVAPYCQDVWGHQPLGISLEESAQGSPERVDPHRVGYLLYVSSRVDEFTGYARRVEPCEPALRDAWKQIFTQTSVGSETRAIISSEAPVIIEVLEELLTHICMVVAHKGCLAEFFDVGNFVFQPGDKTHLLCTRCLLPFPELFMAYLEARQSQESVPFLVILPLHSTVASQPSDCRLRENSKGYGGPKLAFMGDFDEVADLVPPLSGSTPSPSVEPIQQQMINMRKELLDSLKKDHAVARGVRYSEDGSEDTEVGGGVQQPSPLRPGFLSQLSSLQLAEPDRLCLGLMDGLLAEMLSIRKLPVTQPAYQEAAGWLVDPFRIAVPPLSAAGAAVAKVPTQTSFPVPNIQQYPAPTQFPHPSALVVPPNPSAQQHQQFQQHSGVTPLGSAVLAPASAAMHAHVESEMVRFQAWNGGPSFQGTPITFESLLDLPPVVMGLDELVTGTIDGLTVRDPASPSFPNRETVENYSGNSTDKASKAQMQRIMQSPTLGESSEYQYTPLQDRGGDLIQEGSSLRVKDKACREGRSMQLVTKPARFKRDNHPSCYEFVDKSEEDLLRSVERGVLEGPLHYEPWCVTQLGSLSDPVKDKFCNVWNARTSRVNESMAPAPAKYDYLQDVLSRQRPNCLQSGWDLQDAFLNNPRWQPHGDYMGVQLPKSKTFYRARYVMFGLADAPQHQADMSRVSKKMLNQTAHSDGQSECTGIFVDHGHSVYSEHMGKPEADRRTMAKLEQLGLVGVGVSTKKTFMPATMKDFIGREIHSIPQLVTTSSSRAEKYAGAVASLLDTYPEGTPVPRRQLAEVVGKLQFVAPLIIGGQNMLAPVYQSRDQFFDPYPQLLNPRQQWSDTVTVNLGSDSRRELHRFASCLLAKPSRRCYLYEGQPGISGWWTGQHSGDRAYLTRHWETPEGVQAHTMDASGWQGGIAHRDWRHIVS
ncbi:hypothetical protein CYMTET_38183 [Cymbomonas tetramitiformis]|uniref:Uncharacterized protein n=1 Tax=Cymbomonas tetramitiformis TaxID=36881 RepID=A0AAE0F6T6_9CHLO|nr:hypothetical protein CYMTET_38183 [Cymbomonas tetramitiformis]